MVTRPADSRSPAVFCSDASRASDEPLAGTAPHAEVWLLLEYHSRWGEKAFEQSALPPAVKAHLAAGAAALSPARIQLIRQPAAPTAPQRRFFVAVTRAAHCQVHEFHIDDYNDLLALDIQAVAAGDAVSAPFTRQEPLFLICVNGKRDRCCARRGLPVYQAMARVWGAQAGAGDAVWQTTHIGGHRFAGVGLCFPGGVCYGRLGAEDAKRVVHAAREGRIVLDRFRGFTSYDGATQAADGLLRAQLGVDALDALRWLATEHTGEDVWSARFAAVDGVVHRVQVAKVRTGVPLHMSCADPEPSEMMTYRLLAHEVLRAAAP